jgi:hypothetical protein
MSLLHVTDPHYIRVPVVSDSTARAHFPVAMDTCSKLLRQAKAGKQSAEAKSLVQRFSEHAAGVPTWFFVKWIAQVTLLLRMICWWLCRMLAEQSRSVCVCVCVRWLQHQLLGMLSTTESELVHGILLRLAEAYPQALYYSFKISSEDLVGTALPTRYVLSETCRAQVHALKCVLSYVP